MANDGLELLFYCNMEHFPYFLEYIFVHITLVYLWLT